MAVKTKLSEYEELLALFHSNLPTNGNFAGDCEVAFATSLELIGQYLSVESTSGARLLLDATYSAAIEAVSLIALGVARGAVFSIRSHYEFYLMYLYFRTHPVELEAVMSYRCSLPLPAELKKYFRDYLPTFDSRWAALAKRRVRKEEEYYGVLSAVAHGSALESLPRVTKPSEIVVGVEALKDFGTLVSSVSEYLSDVSVAVHEANWLSLPSGVRSSLEARFQGSAQKELFS